MESNVHTYRKILAGDIVEGIQPDVLEKQMDDIEYAVEYLVSQPELKEVYTLEQDVSLRSADAVAARSEEVCQRMTRANYQKTVKIPVGFDADVFVERLSVTRSETGAASRKFTVSVATKLTTTESERGIDHVLRCVKKHNSHILVEFRDKVELKPMTSVICFRPNGPRCLVRGDFMRNLGIVTPGEAEFPDALLFKEEDSDKEPPRVFLESIDVNSELLHVVEEQYVTDHHGIQTTGQRQQLPMPMRSHEKDTIAVCHDDGNAEGKQRDEQKVVSSTSTFVREPTMSANSQMPSTVEKDRLVRFSAQISISELVNTLAEYFSRDDLLRAFEQTEPQTVTRTEVERTLHDQSANEEQQLFKVASNLQMQTQTSAAKTDPLFCQEESTASMPQETRGAVKNLSSPAEKMAPASIISEQGIGHHSHANTEEWMHSDEPISSNQSLDEKRSVDANVMCYRIDYPSSVDDGSQSESRQTMPERSTHSTKIGTSSIAGSTHLGTKIGTSSIAGSTRLDDTGSVMRHTERRYILPTKKKTSTDNRKKPSLEDEMSTSVSSMGHERESSRSSVFTKPSKDCQVLDYAEQAKKNRKKMAVLVRGEDGGTYMENLLLSRSYNASFFPPRTLRDSTFDKELDQHDILITMPSVWKDLSRKHLLKVLYLVDVSGGYHRECMHEITRIYAHLQLNMHTNIQMIDVHRLTASVSDTSASVTKPMTPSRRNSVQPNKVDGRKELNMEEQLTPSFLVSIPTKKSCETTRGPHEEYPIDLTQEQHQVIEETKNAIKRLIEKVNHSLAEKGFRPVNSNFTNERVSIAFVGTVRSWIKLTRAILSSLKENELQEFEDCINLIKSLSDCTILVPLSGTKYVRSIIKSQTKDLGPDLTSEWIPRELQENDSINPNVQEEYSCFSKLAEILERFEMNTAFHAVLYTHSSACIISVEKMLLNCPSLSWLTVTKQFATGGEPGSRMSKTERDNHMTKFIKDEKALLIVSGNYRDVSKGEVSIDAIFFYGVPKVKHNELPMPNNVFTIIHDLM